MGLVEPGLWMALPGAVAVVSSLAFRLIRDKIHAERDKALLEIALRDARPRERREILEGLSALRPLNARAADRGEGPDAALPSILSGRRHRRRHQQGWAATSGTGTELTSSQGREPVSGASTFGVAPDSRE